MALLRVGPKQHRAAAMYSLIISAKMNGVDPPWLADDGVMAFSDCGIENPQELIAIPMAGPALLSPTDQSE